MDSKVGTVGGLTTFVSDDPHSHVGLLDHVHIVRPVANCQGDFPSSADDLHHVGLLVGSRSAEYYAFEFQDEFFEDGFEAGDLIVFGREVRVVQIGQQLPVDQQIVELLALLIHRNVFDQL